MPIPSLPIEIVSEIVSHLRTPLKSDSHEAIEAGQSLSLVCRRWSPIGQALRWNDLEIGTISVPSLLAHFDLHPHLARFVTSFALYGNTQLHDNGNGDGEGVGALPRLLSVLGQLASLDLRQISANLPVVMQTAAPLQHLTELYLLSDHCLDWNERLTSTLVAGLPVLRDFSLTALQDFVLDDDDIIATAPRNLKKVQHISLSWYTSKGSNVVHRFLSIFDPAALRICALVGAPACASAYEWLVACSNLSNLRIAIVCGFLTSNFPSLLDNISKMKSLECIEYRVFGGTRDDFYTLPVSLEVILVSIPSTLERFRVQNLLFADSDESHDLPIPDSVLDDNLCFIEGMVSWQEGYRCAVIWKDKGDKKSKNGHRIVLGFESWNEADET